jgi:hypothetical protein
VAARLEPTTWTFTVWRSQWRSSGVVDRIEICADNDHVWVTVVRRAAVDMAVIVRDDDDIWISEDWVAA